MTPNTVKIWTVLLISLIPFQGVQAHNPTDYLSSRILPQVPPGKVGLSEARLDQIDRAVQTEIDANRLAGAVTLVARHGRIAHFSTLGKMDLETGGDMQQDTIFRMMSMAKPITAVATLMLLEEGKLLMQDPVANYIPAYGEVKVAEPADNESGFITRDPVRPLTLRHLMSHRAGMPYMDEGGFLSDLYLNNRAGDFNVFLYEENLEQYVARLATLPLTNDPGETWEYGFAPDVMGRVIEIVSGQSLDAFFRERIFQPLGMNESGFYIDESKLNRFPTVYIAGEEGRLLPTPFEKASESPFIYGPKSLYSGGGGLISTAMDFTRFCQMLLNGGTLGDVRLISRKSVELMTSNQIAEDTVEPGFFRFWGDKHGLGVAIRAERGRYDELESQGTYGFAGVYYTRFWIDPSEEMIVLLLAQMLPLEYTGVAERVKNIAYGAIVD